MYGHHNKQSMDQPGKVVNPAFGQLNRENEYPPVPVLRIWSRKTGSAVLSRVSLLIFILRLNLVLTYGVLPEFCGGIIFLFKPPYAIGPIPCLSDHATAYRWRSLSRVLQDTTIYLKMVPNRCCLSRSPWPN